MKYQLMALVFLVSFFGLTGCSSNNSTKYSCDIDQIKKIKDVAKRQEIASKCATDDSNIVFSKPVEWKSP